MTRSEDDYEKLGVSRKPAPPAERALDIITAHADFFNDFKTYFNWAYRKDTKDKDAKSPYGRAFEQSLLKQFWDRNPEEAAYLYSFAHDMFEATDDNYLPFTNALAKYLHEGWVDDEEQNQTRYSVLLHDPAPLMAYLSNHPKLVQAILQHQGTIKEHQKGFAQFVAKNRLTRTLRLNPQQEIEVLNHQINALEDLLVDIYVNMNPIVIQETTLFDAIEQYGAFLSNFPESPVALELMKEAVKSFDDVNYDDPGEMQELVEGHYEDFKNFLNVSLHDPDRPLPQNEKEKKAFDKLESKANKLDANFRRAIQTLQTEVFKGSQGEVVAIQKRIKKLEARKAELLSHLSNMQQQEAPRSQTPPPEPKSRPIHRRTPSGDMPLLTKEMKKLKIKSEKPKEGTPSLEDSVDLGPSRSRGKGRKPPP